MILQILMHVEDLEQHVGLVTHTFLQTLIFGSLEIVHQDWLVVGMCAFVDDYPGPFTGTETTDVGEALGDH